jgi:hypothetical protein
VSSILITRSIHITKRSVSLLENDALRFFYI